MKVTFQIPDELYREVKEVTAREGRTLRNLAISLFEQWLRQKKQRASHAPTVDWLRFLPPLAGHVHADVTGHGLDAMRETIARKWNE